MLKFGPCTVTHNGTNLGKTHGGFSLKLNTVERHNVGSMHPEFLVNSGQGKINMYQWESSIIIGDSTALLGFGEVILDGTPAYKVTLFDCKLMLNEDLDGGTNEQKAFVANLFFQKDSNGKLMKLE